MSCKEIFTCLIDHGCTDLSSDIDETKCSSQPDTNGGQGDVFRGNLPNRGRVAIKIIRTQFQQGRPVHAYNKRAAREIYTWSKCNHRNIVPLIGFAVFHDCIAMISRWEENGNLSQYLSQHPSADRCKLSTSICAGLTYLHKQKIVHGDLKGANVLISQDVTPMLIDFGNASFLEATLQFTKTKRGDHFSPRWAAPELFSKTDSHTTSGDVYSLGMTILETFTSKFPFSEMEDNLVIRTIVLEKQTPRRPEGDIPTNCIGADKLWAILTRCWSYDPSQRETAEAVWEEMKGIKAKNLKKSKKVGGWFGCIPCGQR